MAKRIPPEDRFWTKVQKTDTCWLWIARRDAYGYGVFWKNSDPALVKAHRFAYELLVGPIPDGLVIDHLCRVRNCVNPAHLEPVTVLVNTMRGDGLAAENAAKTLCPQGHSYDDANTYVRPHGPGKPKARRCRACERVRQSRYYQANKARRALQER